MSRRYIGTILFRSIIQLIRNYGFRCRKPVCKHALEGQSAAHVTINHGAQVHRRLIKGVSWVYGIRICPVNLDIRLLVSVNVGWTELLESGVKNAAPHCVSSCAITIRPYEGAIPADQSFTL